jgi:putative DNA primase/helicase
MIMTPSNSFRMDTIPAELREGKRWVTYRLEDNGKRKADKVPYRALAKEMFHASHSNPNTWSEFGSAFAVYDFLNRGGTKRYDGLMRACVAQDRITFIDLDNCRDPETRTIKAWAQRWIDYFDSYTEISPSGSGVHIFVYGLPPTEKGWKKAYVDGAVEIYYEKRFATFTGWHVEGSPIRLQDRTSELALFFHEVFTKPTIEPGPSPRGNGLRSPQLTDDQVLEKAYHAKNADKFRLLWSGDTVDYDKDDSRADAALLRYLAFYTQDEAQLDRLFRRSHLNRDKWEHRGDYRERTTRLVLSGLTDVWQPGGNSNVSGNGHSDKDSRFSLGDDTQNEKRESSAFKLMPLDELLSGPDEPVEYLIEGLVTRVGTSIWAAKPKVGKSTGLRTISIDLARAGYTVVYLALEESRQEVKEHFSRLGGQDIKNLLVLIGPVPEDGLLALMDIAHLHRPDFVVVDPLQRFTKIRDLNDYSAVYSALSPYSDVARQYGFHLAWAHHLNKYGDSGDAADAIMASTAIYACVDCAFLIHKRGDRRTMKTDGAQRGGVNLPETVLLYDPDSGRSSLGGLLESAERDDYKQKVLNVLTETRSDGTQEYPEREEQEIRDLVGGDNGKAGKALRSLCAPEDSRVLRLGAGKRGDPYRYRRNSTAKAPASAGDKSRFSFSYIKGNDNSRVIDDRRIVKRC